MKAEWILSEVERNGAWVYAYQEDEADLSRVLLQVERDHPIIRLVSLIADDSRQVVIRLKEQTIECTVPFEGEEPDGIRECCTHEVVREWHGTGWAKAKSPMSTTAYPRAPLTAKNLQDVLTWLDCEGPDLCGTVKSSSRQDWICNRPKGHKGPHLALWRRGPMRRTRSPTDHQWK